ncbi:cleavage polyadenylation factor subunit fip1 [Coemansia sp. RSA 988]|nr:cleavage polyadenylation factor subunit fip1 [Coemansia sp. RSA 988]
MSSIDEDAFIYGDANPPTDANGQNIENTAGDYDADSATHSGDDKDEPVAASATEDPPITAESSNGQRASIDGDSDQDDEGDSSDEEDLEVILEPGSAAAGAQVANAADAAKPLGGADNTNSQNPTGESNEKSNAQALLSTNASHMDILAVPLLNNLDLYTIDIDMLEEKPWRQPGADITDYFNFGFSEEAWKLYCVKQQDVRTKFSAHKMMPPHMMMMPGMNPAMFPGMMNPGFRPDMAGNMYPPGMAPPFAQQKQPGEQGADKEDGDRSSNGGKESEGNAQDRGNGDSAAMQGKDGGPPRMSGAPGMQAPQNPMHMTPQQLQFQQQQQMRMGMPPGFFSGANFPPGMGGMQRGMPMNQQQMMQMQMQMQMGGRPPMPQNPQAAAHQRQGPNTGAGQGSVAMGHQPPPPPPPPPHSSKQHESSEHRNNDKGSDTGRLSRRHASRERSGSRRPPRDLESERHRSQSRHERGRERSRANEREHARGRDSARSEHGRDAPTDSKRSSDRRRERSRDRGGRSRGSRGGNDRSDKPASKRRRSASKEEEPKSASRRRR